MASAYRRDRQRTHRRDGVDVGMVEMLEHDPRDSDRRELRQSLCQLVDGAGEPSLLVRVVSPDERADTSEALVELAAIPPDHARRHEGIRKRCGIAADRRAGVVQPAPAIAKLVERRTERVVLGGVVRGERGGAPLRAPTENERRMRLPDGARQAGPDPEGGG